MDYAETIAATIPMKPPTTECPGLVVKRDGSDIVVKRRWLRNKHYVMLAVVAMAWAFIGPEWGKDEPVSGWLVFGTLFCVAWTYNILAMFVNETTVTASSDRVDVSHGPLASPFGLPRSLTKDEIDHLYAARHGSLFAVHAKLVDGQRQHLVAPLVSSDQANFIVAVLHQTLGQRSTESRSTVSEKGASSGLGWFGLFIPLIVVGALVMFYDMAKSEVSGRLDASGKLGSFSFAPDDCTSGERDGFGGVSLTQKGSSTIVRVVNDPIKGKLIVVVRPGATNQVLDGSTCSAFELDAHRTDTNINDVWVVEGAMKVACSELSGSVEFAGCR